MTMKKFIIAVCIGFSIILILLYFVGVSEILSVFIGILTTILIRICERYFDYREKEKEKILEEQKHRFSKFKEGVSILESRVRLLSTLFDSRAISQFATELSKKLLEPFDEDTLYIGMVELLLPTNRSHLETIINIVLEENITVKKLKEYYNEITNTLETNLFMFPDFQILLHTLFDLLIFYTSTKASKRRLIDILNDKHIKSVILNTLEEYSQIDITTRLSTILAQYIRLIPAIDDNQRQVKITEDMLEDIAELINCLLYSYGMLGDSALQRIYDNLHKKVILSDTSYAFIETCNAYLPQVAENLDQETKNQLFELYNRVKEMIERNKHLVDFPQR